MRRNGKADIFRRYAEAASVRKKRSISPARGAEIWQSRIPAVFFHRRRPTGKIYKMDLSGKVLGWGQVSPGHGADNTGDPVHMLTAPDANTLFVGPGSLWDVEKVTIQG
jgi:hypothetical protein